MKIITKDGAVFTGTPGEIVSALRLACWTVSDYPDEAAYRQGVAERAQMWNGATIRTEIDEEFLSDLGQAGLITIEEEK